MQGLFSPKASFYRGDGTGRDTYVLTDSGGLYRAGGRKMAGPSSGSGSPCKAGASASDAKTFSYHSDGSGRDHYITLNSGGFFRIGQKESFTKSLRSYEKLGGSPTHSPDYFGWAQRTSRPQEKLAKIQRSISQRNTTTRLALPKISTQYS